MRTTRRPVQTTLAGAAVVATTYGLARYSYGLFVPNIRTDFDLSTKALGLIASGSFALYLLATVAAPRLSLRSGPRLPVLLGGSCAIFGMIVIALSRDAWMLSAGVILAGASPGLAFALMPDVIACSMDGDARRGRALVIVNSGTSLGVAVAGPLALLAGPQWRSAWLVFAAVALACTLWIAPLLPKAGLDRADGEGGSGVAPAHSGWARYLVPASGRLFFSAFAAALTTSAYWTFAVDLVVSTGSAPAYLRGTFFVLVGVSGIFGALAGELAARFGLRLVLRATVVALAGALCLLPAASAQWFYPPGILASAALFGAALRPDRRARSLQHEGLPRPTVGGPRRAPVCGRCRPSAGPRAFGVPRRMGGLSLHLLFRGGHGPPDSGLRTPRREGIARRTVETRTKRSVSSWTEEVGA